MKFLITESRLERFINNELNKEYGRLKKMTDKNHPDLIFFIRDVETPTSRDLVFHYNKYKQSAVIPWEMLDSIIFFTDNERESESYVMAWLNETYGLNVVKLYRKL